MSKRIAIDCRFWGLENTGIGRYTMRLVTELAKLDRTNQYYLLLRRPVYEQLKSKTSNSKTLSPIPYPLYPNFHPILADFPEYTIREQLLLAKLLYQLKPDLYHAVDINIPVFWRGKLVVTIHDLTRQTTDSGTTLPRPAYLIKKFIFNHWITPQALHTASAILVPSNFVKNEIINNVETSKRRNVETKTHVTYEAPDQIYYKSPNKTLSLFEPELFESEPQSRGPQSRRPKSSPLKAPYLIYTGTVYPHKNLPKLLEAIKLTNETLKLRSCETICLAIVCARSLFRDRVENYAKQLGLQDQIKFLGFVPDEDLRDLYRNSLAFVTPSLSEGFGLSGLEAMAAGTLVLSSNASCLPEIYGDSAIYFDPQNPHDIAAKIQQVLNLKPAQRQSLVNHAIKHSQTFSWHQMAMETLKIYSSLLNKAE